MLSGGEDVNMASPNGDGKSLAFNGKFVAYAHTVCAFLAFLLALIVGCLLHYKKIVQNASYGYPDEWVPSVSATIGDRYPERSIFQIFIALTSGPRFALIFLDFILSYHRGYKLAIFAMLSGIARTFTCGGWVYITSTDDHDWHDIFMIGYLVLTIPWTVGITLLSEKGSGIRKGRTITATFFFLTLIPLIYWFIQHKVHDIPGAYSIYAYFEWSLIILDVSFDAWSIFDFSSIEISISGEGIGLLKTPKNVRAATNTSPSDVTANLPFGFLEFSINVINSYMFWTILSALFLCVWYFPLWHMGISGYEAVIVITFVSPIILIIPCFRRASIKAVKITRAVSIILGIGSFKARCPEDKLLALFVATGFSVVALVSEVFVYSNDSKKLHSYTVAFILGLLATSVFKFANYSNNPIWPVLHEPNGYNNIGVFAGLIGAFFTPSLQLVRSSGPKRSGGFFLLSALGLGGWFFTIHALLSDSSTLVFWVWNGYPIRGPTPITGALINFIAIALGILASTLVHPNILSSKYYNLLLGGAGSLILFKYDHWFGYAGAMVYSFYIPSVGPLIWQSTVGYNPVLVLSFSFFFSTILSLASVWIVAYAFVPGGWLLRERTDLVLFGSLFMIFIGVLNYYLRNQKSHIVSINIGSRDAFKKSLKVMFILLAIATSAFVKRYPMSVPQPYHSNSNAFTAGIWCVHFGLDNDMWSSEVRMRDLIRDAEVDIIGLLETDTERLIGGNRDFTQRIAEDLDMYVDYGPGPNKHTWGAALLSKFPILNSTHYLLPSPVGELAPAVHATLDIYGELIDVIVFHSGQEEDEEDRHLQSLALRDIMADSINPLVLLSYLVTEPLEGNYNNYVSDISRMHDIDSTDWDRWCEYILFRDLRKVAYARISRSTITDTELQIAKFQILTDEDKKTSDDNSLYGNHYIEEEEVVPELRLPEKFKGEGIRGHRYHVFDEPRYFAPNH